MRLHPARIQPARQPEAVAPGFEGKRNPRDLFTGPDCLIAPAMQQPKAPARPGRGRLRRERHRRSGARAKQSDPGYADRSKVWLARRMAPDRHPGCPGRPTSKRPGAFNAHNPGDGGSGLVQPVFRSPARIPSAESTRKGLCAAPPSEKRYTLSGLGPAPMTRYIEGSHRRGANGRGAPRGRLRQRLAVCYRPVAACISLSQPRLGKGWGNMSCGRIKPIMKSNNF
jgi:hypothetical protein